MAILTKKIESENHLTRKWIDFAQICKQQLDTF